MKTLALILFISLIPQLLAGEQPQMTVVYVIPFGPGPRDIHFASSRISGDSPAYWTSVDGATMWLAQNKNALLMDLRTGRVLSTVAYPPERAGYFDANLVFGDNWAVSNRDTPIVVEFTESNMTVSSFHYYSEGATGKLSNSRPYLLHDTAFFFLEGGNVISIPKGKPPLLTDDTVQMLLQWSRASPTRDRAEKSAQEQLISTGKFLIVDGLLFPSSVGNLVDYVDQMGFPVSPLSFTEIRNIDWPVDGVDMVGNIVIKDAENLVSIFAQDGSLVALVNDEAPYSTQPNSEVSYSIAVNPNGDLLEMNAVRGDKVYFSRAERSWGTDLIGMARDGAAEHDAERISSQLLLLNNAELRILRNTFFALNGYDFQSWDLRGYFKSYEWYLARPGTKADPATLGSNQKRLLDLVLNEQIRRK